MRVVNLSLLAKWRWRLLQNDQASWKDVLESKYGYRINFVLSHTNNLWTVCTFRWWLDVVSLEEAVGSNWFNSKMKRKVGSGENTRFWRDHWVGEAPLCLTYPRLFSISSQKEGMVGGVWVEYEGGGVWEFSWRRNLFVWEVGLLENLVHHLEGWVKSEKEDVWWWKLEEEGVFTVSSTYDVWWWKLDRCGKARLRPRWWPFLGNYYLIRSQQRLILLGGEFNQMKPPIGVFFVIKRERLSLIFFFTMC